MPTLLEWEANGGPAHVEYRFRVLEDCGDGTFVAECEYAGTFMRATDGRKLCREFEFRRGMRAHLINSEDEGYLIHWMGSMASD